MGSNVNESCNNYYLENTVFVAVSKHVKDSESVLSWAANKFGRKKKICLLYVHQPASLVSFFGGKLTVSKFQQRAINALREADVQKLHKLLGQYVLQLSNMGIHADRMWIEMDNVEEGIVDMIVQHGIKWLVMGAAADKYYKKDMTELKSQKAIFVCEQAPVFCHIWFICRGNLISTRKGVNSSVTTESLNVNVANIGQKHDYLDVIGENASREQQSIPSNIIDKDPEQIRVESPSDFSTDESESSPLSDEIEESEDERIDYMLDGHMSPPRLTFRELGPILRTCSVDFDSQMEHHLKLSAPFNISLSAEKRRAVEGKRQIIRSHSSSSLASFQGKMEGKARLQTLRDISSTLEQAISDTNNVKQLAFQESVQRWRAEEDAMDAKKKAAAAEYKFAKVMKQRKDVEEDLARQKSEHIRFKEEHDKFCSELPIIQAECSDLEDQVRDSEIAAKELEEKIISAVELLISFRKKRDQLELERDNAIQEMERLQKLMEQRVAAFSGPRFPTFSSIEIGEATCGFDPSKKIGDGTYGSIYQGMLGHMEVAIRILPNDGIQAQLMFEHQVEILSRIRHPNIVAPIGICPEARSIVYEYLERGSLDDNLACRGRTRGPLPWQTRVRIATELCSALIFLHTNNPPFFHGNLKPTKILLDANFVSKIGDLGIFHLILENHRELLYGPNSQNLFSVYTDPEFLSTGVINPLSDVYSFGMIILHLITGAPGIVKDVKRSLQSGKVESILDFSAGDWPVNQVKSLARVALQCCDRNPSKRPDLGTKVWSVLEALRNSCDAQISFQQNQENRRPPSHFLCPIYQEVMKDPCTAGDGYTYEGDAIKAWLDSGHTTSPMTNLKLPTCDLIPNHALHYAIQEWLQRS